MLDGLITWGERIGALAIFAIATVVLYDIVARAFGYPTLWVLEAASYLMIAASVLAAGEVMRKGGHFDVRLFLDMFPAGLTRWIDRLAAIVTACVIVAVTFGIWQLMVLSHALGMRSPTIYHVPLVIPQAVLLSGFVLLSLAALAKAVGEFRTTPSEPDQH